MLRYRKDIDGLRALAVIPVLLFHVGFNAFSGGFVGVDVFFVISGYLITSILIREIEGGKFSIAGFYERHARRILPALFAVVLGTLIGGYFVLFPDEYQDLAESAFAAILFFPNIHFWQSIGYFAIESSTTPLLHTWSLGIEEQFYILFPIILFSLFKFLNRKAVFSVIVAGFVLSFSYNALSVVQKPDFTFYFITTRAWELLAGSVLAFNIIPSTQNNYVREFLSAAGLLFILLAIFLVDEHTLFPGYWGLLPVLGAALIIYAGDEGAPWVNRILSIKPLVIIGLISYSLYLWHWPITVYANLMYRSGVSRFAILGVSFVIAYVSYLFIEQPFRKRVIGETRKTMFAYALLAIVGIVVLTQPISRSEGLPARFGEDVLDIANPANYLHPNRDCHFKTLDEIKNGDYCRFGVEQKPSSFALIGDSHADALRPALEEAARLSTTAGIQLTTPGCRPLLNVYRPGSKKCKEVIDEFVKIVVNEENIDTVFLTGYWKVPYNGFGYRNDSFIIHDEFSEASSTKANKQVFERGIKALIETLAGEGITVVVVGDVPDIGFSPRNQLAREKHLNIQGDLTIPVSDDEANLFLKRVVESYDSPLVMYVDIAGEVCPNNECSLIEDGTLTFRDGDHLSAYRSEKLGALFAPILTKKHPT